MRNNHKKAISNLVNYLSYDSNILAIIITGSVVKGTAREDSDIDCYLLATDKHFASRKKDKNLFYINYDVCEYPGGFIDGRIINFDFIKQAGERGDEPTRASFNNAFIAFSKLPDLESYIIKIPVYQDRETPKKILEFYSQIYVYSEYFSKKAIELNNQYLLITSIHNLVLFSGRLILTINKTLYPGHKSLIKSIEFVSKKPEGYLNLVNELMKNPNEEKIDELWSLMKSFVALDMTYTQAVNIFLENNDWNWLDNIPRIQD